MQAAKALLIDEDTSATNFMVRDELMQSVIAKDKEPITPFIDQARNLYKNRRISYFGCRKFRGVFSYRG